MILSLKLKGFINEKDEKTEIKSMKQRSFDEFKYSIRYAAIIRGKSRDQTHLIRGKSKI